MLASEVKSHLVLQEEKNRKEEEEAKKKAADDAKKKNILASLNFTGYKVTHILLYKDLELSGRL